MVLKNRYNIILVLIILSGLLLRVWGIDFGLPYQFHQDEAIIVNHALAYGTGDLNPHYFAIPPFVSYILFFLYGLFFIVSKIIGTTADTTSFALSFLKDPTPFYAMGRIFIGLIPGVLSVYFTYILYKRILSSKAAALFAAGIIAFNFLSVIHSHYIYADTLMSFFVLLSIILIAEIQKRPDLKSYIYAGLVLGLAVGTKYNAAFLILPYLIAHLMACKESRKMYINLNIISGLLTSAAVFFIINPYALLNFNFFVNEIINQGRAEGYTGFAHHIVYSLRESTGVTLLALSGSGIVLLFIRDVKKALLLLSFPLAFYMHIVFFGQHFPRYALPLMPFVAVAAGYFLYECLIPVFKNRAAQSTVVFLSSLLFLPLIIKSAKVDLLFSSYDTRVEAAEWIRSNISRSDPIAVDHTFFRPAISQNREQLISKYQFTAEQKGLESLKEKKFKMMLEAQPEGKGYFIYFLSSDPEAQGQFFSTLPSLGFDFDILKENNIKYLVINYANRYDTASDFYNKIKDEAVLIKSFSPYFDNSIRFSRDRTATTCMPLLSSEIYSRGRSGPAIEIYRIRE